MAMAAPPLMKSLPIPKLSTTVCATISRSHYPAAFSLPSKATKFSLFSISTSWVSLKQRISPLPITVPFVAQTSDWAQQDAEEEGGEEAAAESGGEELYPDPPEEAKLFVGNLPYDIDSEKLAQLFNQAGIVEISEVIYNRETDQSRGFGFVTMSTVEEADKAVEMFSSYDLNGRVLTVNKAAPRGSQAVRTRAPLPTSSPLRIYVGNLPWQVDDARLEQVFSEHGKVVSARVISDRETGRSRGFGFVTMSNEAEVNDAIAALDGQSLEGRPLRVNVAQDRERRSSF